MVDVAVADGEVPESISDAHVLVTRDPGTPSEDPLNRLRYMKGHGGTCDTDHRSPELQLNGIHEQPVLAGKNPTGDVASTSILDRSSNRFLVERRISLYTALCASVDEAGQHLRAISIELQY